MTWDEKGHQTAKVFLLEFLGTFIMILALLQIKNKTHKLTPLSQ